MVKRSRLQSQEAPSRLSWVTMAPPASAFHERLAADVLPRLSLRRELPLHHVLRGDASVIGAEHPQRLPSVHPLVTNEDVLERVVQGVPHMERARHVRGRVDDAVGLAGPGGVDVEVTARLPLAIPAKLGGGRIVAVGEVSHDGESIGVGGK
jgi:hypothetical protein